MREALRQALERAVAESNAPGGVACVGDVRRVFFLAATGLRQVAPESLPAQKDTIYDLASLTKVVATATSIMLLRDEGALDLDQPVSELIPIPAFGAFTVRHLLTHTAGLVAGLPFYKTASSMDEMLQRYASVPIDWTPGTRHRYSDVGFMILGKVVELVARDSLDDFCAKRIFKPLGMDRTGYKPPEAWARDCASTENCSWRGRLMTGVVHDENAYAVGGVSGHAGLFAPADDLAKFCRALLTGKLLKESTLAEMTRFGQVPRYPWQGLGWKLDPWSTNNEGFLPSRAAFGHTGWTGTTIWMDREKGLFAILLGNTCHPTRAQRDNGTFRRVFYSAVARDLYARSSNTHSGLDRLLWDDFGPLKDKRIALLTNHAAVDELGRPILDVLAMEPRVKLTTLYSPEHGIQGKAEAGERVGAQEGNIPVISLYGDRKRPSSAELAAVDTFVLDLQDVGARYYTYMAAMLECMKACAEAGMPMLVLDRPNPTGGDVLEGPIATQIGADVCCASIPVRHGMTMGELALFFAKDMPARKGFEVTVFPLDSWRRDRWFGECSLPWIPPSPNMPTPETALIYPGMCLFEGTNLNEGRGTDTPFFVVGAPWLDAKAIVRRIGRKERPGCSLEAIEYTPRAIPGKASNPRYKGQPCRGIQVTIRDPRGVRAFTLAVALLSQIRQRHPKDFEMTPFFDTLAGSDDLRKRIEARQSARQIVEAYAPALDAFDAKRPKRYE